MASLGTLSAILSLNSAPLEAGAGRAEKRLGSLRDTMSSVVSKAAIMGGSIATGAAAGLALLTKRGLEAVDSQAKLARQLGGTITGLRALEGAAGDAGISSEGMASAMERLNARIGEAQRGTGTAAESFERLGLNANELARMDVDDRAAAIADRMKEMGLSTQQAGDELRQMGIRQGEVINLMLQGGDAIREERKTVEALGLALSEVDARQVEMANDALGVFGDLMTGIKSQLAVAAAPFITQMATDIEDAAKAAGGWKDEIKSAIELGIKGFGKLLDVLHGVRVSFKLMQVASAELETGLKSFAGFVGIGDGADDAKQRAAKLREELHQLAVQEMPSDKAAKFLEDVRKRSEEAAQAAVSARTGNGSAFTPTAGGEKEETEAEKYRRETEEKLNAIRERFMAEDELQIARFEAEQLMLNNARDARILSEQEHKSLMEQLEQEHQDNLNAIKERGLKSGLTFLAKIQNDTLRKTADGFAAAIQTAATSSKKMFDINKALSLANALVTLPDSIIQAVRNAGGLPFGAFAGAATAAQGIAQIAAIKSTNFGGGGASGSVAGAANPANTTQAPAQQQQRASQAININVAGGLNPEDLYSGKMIRALFDELNANIDNGMSFNVQ